MKRKTMRVKLLLLWAAMLVGCTPTLNWRQANVDASDVKVLLPCKPDQATRTVVLRAETKQTNANLSLQGCEAGQMQFTFGAIAVPPGLTTDEVLQAWRLASLAPLNASPKDVTSNDREIRGLKSHASSARVVTKQNQVQWLWFIHDNVIYQAAVYGAAKEPALAGAAETYFSGIELP